MKNIAIFIVTILLIMNLSVPAKASSKTQELDEQSDAILQMVKIKRYEEAKAMLLSFSEQFLKVEIKKDDFTMDELIVISTSYDEAIETLEDNTVNHEEKLNSVTKLRLVMDAVSSNHRPLWTELENRMMNSFDETNKAALEKDYEAFSESLDRLLIQYDLIYYSLKVDLAPETVQQLDARFYFIDQYRPNVLANERDRFELEVLQQDMKKIFNEMKEDEADPSLWWVIISTGSIIIGTLAYVGWRKYRGYSDNQKIKNKQKN